MEYVNLGQSDLKVSRIGFGCMSLGSDHAANNRLLDEALDYGINFFDTADLYDKGINEETVGKAFKNKRSRVIIATKVGNQWRPDGSGWDWNPTKKYILASIHRSLERLQTGYIDLYQLHGGTIEDNIDETISAFEELKSAGYIRQYGISSIRPNVIREYVKRSDIASNMIQYSLLDRRPEEHCLDLLHRNNVGAIVRGALAKGRLAGKPPSDYLAHSKEEVQNVQQLIRTVGGSLSPAHVALRYCLAHPAVSTIAIGIRTREQLKEVAGVLDQANLTKGMLDRLKSGTPTDVYTKHR